MKKRWLWAALAALSMVATLFAPIPTAEAVEDGNEGVPQNLVAGRYVVVLDDVPLITEFGRDRVNTPEARNRGQQMKAEQQAIAQSAGVAAIGHTYTNALNGFSAQLNEGQVAALKSTAGVMLVMPEQMLQLQTESSLDFIGVSGNNGPNAHRVGVDGEGVIVGVIDSGIWPEHPSFADDGSYANPGVVLDETFRAACDFGNTARNSADAPASCNNKLLGARDITDIYRLVAPSDPSEFWSARDDDGHGTHTAGTAAGNAGVPASVLGTDHGEVSGVAPRAHIIAYKACGALGCVSSDLAAAVDQAVADGVDVINFSIGGGARTPDITDIAFLFAADAGVRVATSAGNSGPGASTVGNPATVPWITSVGANTQSRFFQGTVELGNGATYVGSSMTGEAPESPLVDAEFAGGDLCVPGTLDPALVAGSIVLCRRGAIARVAKSAAVQAAGGVGMIMYENSDVGNLFSDNHFVPTVHVDNTPGLAIKAYIASDPAPTAALVDTATSGVWEPAPSMTAFSSRGPSAVAADIIKPDITAPGFQILAAYSPHAGVGDDFAAIAGTSMSSPHVAGLFALLAQEHPDWSAAATKSALMTTANPNVRDNDRVSQASAFAMGSGMANIGSPRSQGSGFQPGLVYEANFFDYLGFICGAFPSLVSPGFCASLAAAGVAVDPVDLNYPSIGISELAGSRVVTRTVTSVVEENGWRTFTPSVIAPAGYEVEVTPPTLRLKSGMSATYQVRITNVSGPVGMWREGSITWQSQNYSVRSPIVVRGIKMVAPASVDGVGVDGAASIPITFGYEGAYSATAHGLEPATVFSGTVAQDPNQSFDRNDGFSDMYQVTANDSALLRIAMPPDAVSHPNADVDIFVYDSAGDLVASSTAAGTEELIDLQLPADDTYDIWVHGWSAPGGSVDYALSTWLISNTPGGNLTVDSAPGAAAQGSSGNVEVSWTGAAAGAWHLGAVMHADGTGPVAMTLVEVDNR